MPFVKGQPKIAGRAKGTPNKSTVRRRQLRESIVASGKDPMTFFAEVLGNEANPFDVRFEAAEALMPYMHPRLASIESRRGGKTHEERLAEARERMARRNALSLTRSDATDLEPISNGSHLEQRGVMSEPAGGGDRG